MVVNLIIIIMMDIHLFIWLLNKVNKRMCMLLHITKI